MLNVTPFRHGSNIIAARIARQESKKKSENEDKGFSKSLNKF